METTAAYSTDNALETLCALSQQSRLDIVRLLVTSGPEGLPAGAIARECNLPAPTCSFHLKELKKGGLLSCCRHGRSQIYTVNFRAIRALLGYLTEHCCTEARLRPRDFERRRKRRNLDETGIRGRIGRPRRRCGWTGHRKSPARILIRRSHRTSRSGDTVDERGDPHRENPVTRTAPVTDGG